MQDQQRRLVAMGEQIKIAIDGKVDDLLDQRRLRGAAIDVEFTDAAEIAAFVFDLDQVVDGGIGRPVLHIVAGTIGPDERHDPKPRRLGVDELMGALVRAAVCHDAGDAVAAKDVENAIQRIIRIGLLVVVQMRVEDLEGRLRTGRNRYCDDQGDDGDDTRDSVRSRHGKPSSPIRRAAGLILLHFQSSRRPRRAMLPAEGRRRPG
jgi:hypothetical protein